MHFYVSKEWINRFNTFAEPGPVTNEDFLCPHGGRQFIQVLPTCIPTDMNLQQTIWIMSLLIMCIDNHHASTLSESNAKTAASEYQSAGNM